MINYKLLLIFFLIPIVVCSQDNPANNYDENNHFTNDRCFYSLKDNYNIVLYAKKDWSISIWENNILLDGYGSYYKDYGYWMFEDSKSNTFEFQYISGKVDISWKKKSEEKSHSTVLFEVGDLNNKQNIKQNWLLKDVNGCLYLKNTDSQVLNDKAYYLDDLGFHNEAVMILQLILLYKPNRTVAYINLGDAYWGLNENLKAIEAYNKYIELMKANGKESKIPKRILDRIR